MRYVETSLEESALQEDLKLIREQVRQTARLSCQYVRAARWVRWAETAYAAVAQVESLEASQALQQTIERGLTWQIQQLTPVGPSTAIAASDLQHFHSCDTLHACC